MKYLIIFLFLLAEKVFAQNAIPAARSCANKTGQCILYVLHRSGHYDVVVCKPGSLEKGTTRVCATACLGVTGVACI